MIGAPWSLLAKKERDSARPVREGKLQKPSALSMQAERRTLKIRIRHWDEINRSS